MSDSAQPSKQETPTRPKGEPITLQALKMLLDQEARRTPRNRKERALFKLEANVREAFAPYDEPRLAATSAHPLPLTAQAEPHGQMQPTTTPSVQTTYSTESPLATPTRTAQQETETVTVHQAQPAAQRTERPFLPSAENIRGHVAYPRQNLSTPQFPARVAIQAIAANQADNPETKKTRRSSQRPQEPLLTAAQHILTPFRLRADGTAWRDLNSIRGEEVVIEPSACPPAPHEIVTTYAKPEEKKAIAPRAPQPITVARETLSPDQLEHMISRFAHSSTGRDIKAPTSRLQNAFRSAVQHLSATYQSLHTRIATIGEVIRQARTQDDYVEIAPHTPSASAAIQAERAAETLALERTYARAERLVNAINRRIHAQRQAELETIFATYSPDAALARATPEAPEAIAVRAMQTTAAETYSARETQLRRTFAAYNPQLALERAAARIQAAADKEQHDMRHANLTIAFSDYNVEQALDRAAEARMKNAAQKARETREQELHETFATYDADGSVAAATHREQSAPLHATLLTLLETRSVQHAAQETKAAETATRNALYAALAQALSGHATAKQQQETKIEQSRQTYEAQFSIASITSDAAKRRRIESLALFEEMQAHGVTATQTYQAIAHLTNVSVGMARLDVQNEIIDVALEKRGMASSPRRLLQYSYAV